MSRAEGLVSYHTSAPVHALLTPAAVAFVAALKKVLWKLTYHRPLEAKESGHDRSGLKDLCPFPLVHSAWELSLSSQPHPCLLLGLSSSIRYLSGVCCGVRAALLSASKFSC